MISKTEAPNDSQNFGVVYLVGAGPGDPELITVKGLRLLKTAEIVIHDRLIPHELLDECDLESTIIDVGKYPDHHRISQPEINALIIYHALRGRNVVRLKGGDPFVFGRGTEEVDACRRAGIACEIVPGISSAIAAPSAAGIPVTSRGVARSFLVMTGQTAPQLGEHQIDYSAMAQIDTLVLMMARRNLRELTAGLISAGRDPETPVACIERATYADQRVTYATLHGIADQIELLGMANPMVTVIGEVAAMVDPNLIEWPNELHDHFYAYEFGE